MAVLHFLSKSHRKNLSVVHINHRTEFAYSAQTLVEEFCNTHGIPCQSYKITDNPPPKETSMEEFWRNERYNIFHAQEKPVLTVHHLNDCVETWLFTSLHGQGKIIPYQNKNVFRPFLLSKREGLLHYCQKKSVPYVLDPSNDDTSFMRNFIRHELMPKALVVNPGLAKVIAKKVAFQYEQAPPFVETVSTPTSSKMFPNKP